MVIRVLGLASANRYLRVTGLCLDMPISSNGRPQSANRCFPKFTTNHQIMNPFCAIPYLLAKDQAAVSYSTIHPSFQLILISARSTVVYKTKPSTHEVHILLTLQRLYIPNVKLQNPKMPQVWTLQSADMMPQVETYTTDLMWWVTKWKHRCIKSIREKLPLG